VDFRKWKIGEGLLWLGFLGVAAVSLDHGGPENGVAIAGLFALAAIGVRATRSGVPSSEGNKGED
jgi:hypothetical protein